MKLTESRLRTLVREAILLEMGSYWDTSIMDDEARDYFRDRLPDWPPFDYPEPGEFDDLTLDQLNEYISTSVKDMPDLMPKARATKH